MSVLPKKLLDRIQFLENHIQGWTTNATAIGTTSTKVTALAAQITATRGAYDSQQQAQDAARTATLNLHTLGTAMTTGAAEILKDVKAKAATDGDNIYVLAAIPAPATPAPVPAPGTPGSFTAQLIQGGGLKIAWKCANPTNGGGTVYQVARQVGSGSGTGGATIIGSVGARMFIDNTIPAGSAAVTYTVTGMRSTVAGLPGQFTVQFGTSGTGSVTIVENNPSPKLAA